MRLHVETTGCGAPLVLLHGWGMHGGMWGDAVARLAQSYTVHNVDLPGFGGSPALATTNLDTLVCALSERFTDPLHVCGWSLGGQVALHWALREPAGIYKLIVVASTPCFTVRETWPCAMPREVLEKFAAELEQDPVATLRRFIALQLRGSDKERELLARMREQLFRRGQPEREALRAGLAILRDADQRGELAKIRKPTLVITGQRDTLAPPEAGHFLAHAMPNARLVEITGAAHVPFLSHPELFVEHVERFLNE